MRYTLLLCLCSLVLKVVMGQHVDCAGNFRHMVEKIEQNYVGFEYKVTAANRSVYEHLKDSLQESLRTADVPGCLQAMTRYLEFFRDRHVNIAINDDSANHTHIREAFGNTGRVPMPEQALKSYLDHNRHQLDSLEGIWEDASGFYRVGIIREKGARGHFTGFILKADSLFWMPGQVKMKIRKLGNEYAFTAFYSLYHIRSTPVLTVTRHRFENGSYGSWYKVYPGKKDRQPETETDYRPYFRALDKQTCLLAIPSAMLEYKDDIDSILEAQDGAIKSAAHFIIDLRDNRGGSVLCFENLLPLLYTNPIITKGASVLATEDNIKGYEIWDYPNISDSMKAVFRKEAAELRAHVGTLYNLWPDDTITMSTILPYPRRVSILINEACASSTEMFLLKARQSSKVKLYGRHTMGAVDYADYAALKLPGDFFILRYSTSRSNRLPEYPIDNIGIQPDIIIPDHVKDWISFIREKKYLNATGQ